MVADDQLKTALPESSGSVPRSSGQARWLLLGLVALAAAMRTYWGAQPRIVWGDEPFYLWLGQSLLNGEGYQFFGISGVHASPLYPLLAGLIGRLVATVAGNSPQVLASGSVVLYIACGSLLVLPIYGIARRTAGRRAAVCAGLATAIYPVLTARVPLWGTMTEPIYLLLVASAWWGLLFAHQERRLWGYLAAGAALGLAYLTRNEAIVYLVAGLGAALLIELAAPNSASSPHPGSKTATVRRTLIGAALAVGIFAVLISPYLVALHAQTGKWQLLEEAGSTYVSAQGLAYNDLAAFDRATWGLDPASGEVYFFSPTSEGQGLLTAIAADPREFLRLLRVNLTDLLATVFSNQLVPPLMAFLAVLGLFAQPWDARRLRGELLLIASLAGPLSFLVFFIQARYLAGVLIPALIWIGGGTAWLGEWLAQSWAQIRAEKRGVGGMGMLARDRTRDLLRALPALLLSCVLLWQTPRMWNLMQGSTSLRGAHLAAAAKIRELGASGDDVILSRYPAIAFHAGTRWAPTPAATWPEVAAYAQRKGACYLAFDAAEATLRPQLAFLLDPAQAPSELLYLSSVEDSRAPVLLYRFR